MAGEIEMMDLGLDPASVWDFGVADGVAHWRSKSGLPTSGSSVKPVIADDEEVVYAHELRIAD